MTFSDLNETCFQQLGLVNATTRLDFKRQSVKDSLNQTVDHMMATAPYFFRLVREGTMSLVNGTSTYTPSDWLKRPLSIYLVNTSARRLYFKRSKTMDGDGSRNTNLTFTDGQNRYELAPRSTTAVLFGAAASATEGASTITGLVSAGGFSQVTSAVIGRMIRLNGEDNDYQIVTTPTSASVTVDRPIRARLTGVGTTNTGAGYASVPWQIGPIGAVQVRFTPTPNTSLTVYFRGQYNPRRMINLTDEPEINTEYHHLIWKGALRQLANLGGDRASAMAFAGEYAEALADLSKSDTDDFDDSEGADYAAMLPGDESWLSRLPPGTDTGRRAGSMYSY